MDVNSSVWPEEGNTGEKLAYQQPIVIQSPLDYLEFKMCASSTQRKSFRQNFAQYWK